MSARDVYDKVRAGADWLLEEADEVVSEGDWDDERMKTFEYMVEELVARAKVRWSMERKDSLKEVYHVGTRTKPVS